MASTIILSDNGASSGSAGLKSTAGNDGVLLLQTTTSGGTATTAIAVDTTQRIGMGTTSPSTAAKLHLYGASSTDCNQRIEAQTGTDKYVDIGTGGSGHYVYGYGAYSLYLGTNNATRMVIDSSGRVTTAYQPAFNAYNASSGNPVLWASTTVNVGSCYNSATGRFTAPVAGVYLFYVSLHGSNVSGGIADFRLSLNGSGISGGGACASPSNYAQATGVVVYSLAAGDYVYVSAYHAFTNDGGLSYFGGYLLG